MRLFYLFLVVMVCLPFVSAKIYFIQHSFDGNITSETDPQVGNVTADKWCKANGTAINCDESAPAAGNETDPYWSGNSTLVYYASNPYGFYNSSTLPAYPTGDNASWNENYANTLYLKTTPYQSSAAGWTNTSTATTTSKDVGITSRAATAVPLTINGYAAQSANLQEWKDSSGNKKAIITKDGYLGIGIDSVTTYFHLASQSNYNPQTLVQNSQGTAAGGGGYYVLQRSRGTIAAPIKINASDTLGTFLWKAYNGSSWVSVANMYTEAEGISGAKIPTRYMFRTMTSSGTFNVVMMINSAGSVGIGTGTTSPNYKLHIYNNSDTNVLRLQDSDGTCDANPESGSVTWTCTSDLYTKENIKEVNKEELINRINTYATTIKEYDVISGGETKIGTIAQDLQAVLPDMVVERPVTRPIRTWIEQECSNDDCTEYNLVEKTEYETKTELGVKTFTEQELTLSDAYIRDDIAAINATIQAQAIQITALQNTINTICKNNPSMCETGIEIG